MAQCADSNQFQMLRKPRWLFSNGWEKVRWHPVSITFQYSSVPLKTFFQGERFLMPPCSFPPPHPHPHPHPVPLNECSTWSRPDFPSKKKRATGYIRRWWRMIQLSVHDGVVDATALFTLALPIQWLVWDVSISIHSNTRWKSTLSSISYSKSDFLKNIYISLVKIHLFRSSFDLSIVDWNITYLIGDSNSATLKFDGVYQ